MKNTEELKEKRKHGSFVFHFEVYEISNNFPDILPHWHEELEILFGIEGETHICVGEDTYTIKPNQVLIVPCNEVHYCTYHTEQYLCYAILFDVDMLSGTFVDSCYLKYIAPIKENQLKYNHLINDDARWGGKIVQYTSKILDYYFNKPFGYELGIKGALTNLFFELISNNKSEKPLNEKNEELEKLKYSISYIKQNYMNKITIEEIAEKSFMSVYHFCRYFKKVISMTPMNYINQYRIHMASELLQKSNKPITVIAFEVGFNDSSYFSKIFFKTMNCSPSDYRRLF